MSNIKKTENKEIELMEVAMCKIGNERGNIKTDIIQMQRIMKDYYNILHN